LDIYQGSSMARRIRSVDLETRTARSQLRGRGKPYWCSVEKGVHLGYRRPRGRRGRPAGAGAWVIRQYLGSGAYLTETIAVADDFSDADTAVGILTFWQAVDLVRARMVKRARGAAGVPGTPVTVRAICEAYLEYMESHKKTAADSRYRLEAFVYPNLGDIDAETLTADVVRKWLAHLAASAPRVRTKAGAKQQFRAHDVADDESVRKRKTSANRTWGTLRAALNFAVADGKLSNVGWQRVKPFKGVSSARVRFLSVDQCQRLINACEPAEFRPLVEAALQTGCRYGELGRLRCGDFDADAGALAIRLTKSGKPRFATLTEEGVALFSRLAAGRGSDEFMLRKADGSPWGKGQQNRPLADACKRAGIVPPINFHALRHTYASLSVMAGAPLLVVARALGHATTRMTEMHYAHLSPSFEASEIRRAAPRFGIAPDPVVTQLRKR
jgi:integrase